MVLKVLKIVGLVILGVFLLLFGISFSKVDKDSTNKLKDAWNNLFKKTASKLLLGNDSTTTDSKTDKTETATSTPKVYAKDKIALTYEGQPIYKKYNGKAAPSEAIGYLENGTLLTPQNTTYADGEYKKKPTATPPVSTNPLVTLNLAGVNTSNYLGEYIVSGTWSKIYGYKTGINLLDYYNAFGFLVDGTIVYREIINVGYEDEYETYHV